jgi:hypothetical protein
MNVIDNAQSVDHVFALIYGASGSGKTDFCGQLGGLGNTLIIDADVGSMTIRRSPRVKPFLKNVTVVSFDKFGDLDAAYKAMQKNDPKEWSRIFSIGEKVPTIVEKPFDWIVWDSWSELQWNMMQKLREDKGMLSANGDLTFRKNIEIQHWGMMTDLNKLAIESFRNVPMNQVYVMLETVMKDDVSGQVIRGPAIHGKLVNEMPGYFNIVIHSYVDLSGKYCATTKPVGGWVAKTRLSEGANKVDPKPKDFFSLT